jgi:mannose/fructose/N-acetylgalactosamine-specific phosphotransferase system component IID
MIQMKKLLNEIYSVIKVFDNVVTGMLAVGAVMLLYWLWQVFGWYLIGIPVGFVVMTFIGKSINDQIAKYKSNEN